MGLIPILRAFCSDEVYLYCRNRAIPCVAAILPILLLLSLFFFLGVRYHIMPMFATALIQAPWVPWSLYIMINFAQTIARGPPSSLQTQWYLIFSLVCILNEYQHEHEHSGSSVGRVWDFFVCFLLIAQWLQHKPWQITLFSTKPTNFALDMFVWSNTTVQYDPPTWRWVKILRIEPGWALGNLKKVPPSLCTLTLGYSHHPK